MSFREYILFAVLLVYLVFTFLFAIKFRKTVTIYSPKQKQLHSILIWLIPFIWILLLKSLSKPTPGSHHYPNKKSDGGFDDNGMTSWVMVADMMQAGIIDIARRILEDGIILVLKNKLISYPVEKDYPDPSYIPWSDSINCASRSRRPC